MKRLSKTIALVLFAGSVAGCATRPPAADATAPRAADGLRTKTSPSRTGDPDAQKPSALAVPAAQPPVRSEPTLIRGDDRFFRASPPTQIAEPSGESISLHFEQAPLTDVVHAVLGDMLKVPYSIAQPLSGDVTLHTHSPVPRSQVIPLLEALLQANGFAMLRDPEGVYFVGKAEALRGLAPSIRSSGTALPPGLNMVIVPLKFVGAVEMADILKPIASPAAFLRIDSVRNTLMLAGTRNQIDGWLQIVETFDIDAMRGMSIGFFPLHYVSAKDVELALKALFTSGGAGGAQAEGGRTAAAAAASQQDKESSAVASAVPSAPLPLGPLTGVVRVLPLDRMNGVLVVTSRSHYLDTAREWIEKFDQPGRSGGEPQLFVYPVQNGTASHLASLLSGVFGGAAQGGGGASTDSGVAPGLRTGSMSLGGAGSSSGRLGSLGGGLGGGGTGMGIGGASGYGASGSRTATAPSVTQLEFGGKVRVVADPINNSLLIYATGADYGAIERALKQLDRAPAQVLIEASIIEVTLTDELQYGLQWTFDGLIGNGGYRGTGVLSPGANGSLGRALAGFSYTVTNSANSVRAVLSVLADKSLLNVISTPSVMVLDNHTAAIQVGDQQPIRSSTIVTDGGVTTSSIQYKDTGVLLTVTPSVNAGDMISMDINQAVTDVGGQIDAATGQRPFNQRQFSSRVAVRSGETVVLGGLIRDNKTNAKQGLPVLQDLPLVGSLFGTNTITKERTELMVMLTPRVLRSDQDLREVGAELRARLTGMKPNTSAEVLPPAGSDNDPPAEIQRRENNSTK